MNIDMKKVNTKGPMYDLYIKRFRRFISTGLIKVNYIIYQQLVSLIRIIAKHN